MIFVFLVLVVFWLYYYLKLFNPFKLILIIGKKGSGKSTTAVSMIKSFQGSKQLFYDSNLKKWQVFKWQVYTNISGLLVDGVRFINAPERLGELSFPPFSFVVIDEVNLLPGWDNREFKKMNKSTISWLRYQRKHMVRVLLISQTFDIDKKIRSLTDSMFLNKCILGCFSCLRKIDKTVDIESSALDADSQLVDKLAFAPWWIPFSGNIKFLFIPKYMNLFQSYDPPELPSFDFVEISCPKKRSFYFKKPSFLKKYKIKSVRYSGGFRRPPSQS